MCFWPLWFASPFIHLAHFHLLIGPLKPSRVQLSCGSRQEQWRTEHPNAPGKVGDMETRWLDKQTRRLQFDLRQHERFLRKDRCVLPPRPELLSSDVGIKMCLLCDHGAARAARRPCSKTENETWSENERAGEKKPKWSQSCFFFNLAFFLAASQLPMCPVHLSFLSHGLQTTDDCPS